MANDHAEVVIDAAGVVRAWSPGATELFGYEADEALGLPLATLVIPGPMRTAHAAGLRRLAETGNGPLLDRRLDVPAVRRDGSAMRVELTVRRDGDRFLGRMRETHHAAPVPLELLLSAESHQRRERVEVARMTALIEALHDGVLLQDEQQRVVLANSAFVELFALGLSPQRSSTQPQVDGGAAGGTAAGRGLSHAFTHAFADREAAERRMQETVRRGRPTVGEEVHLTGGRVLQRDYIPVTLDGTTHGHLWVFHDITAQAQIRRGLEERNRMLTEVSALKTEFIRVASHELRTPLTSIATFASMLRGASDGGELDAEDRDAAVSAISRNAARMQVLVADLLLLAKLDSGELPLDRAPIDPAELLREVCDEASVPAPAAPPSTMEADRSLLRELLRTAVGVVDAAGDGGCTVDAIALPRNGSSSPDRWTVRVHAPTEEPATDERLLSTRLPHPDADGEYRTGALALMLAREIAARHGGELATSVEPAGVTVTIDLPMGAASSA